MGKPLTKLLVPLPALLQRTDFEPEVSALLAPVEIAADGLQVLADKGLLKEAVHLVAHALPRREAVWWACMCADATAGASVPAADRAAREAAEAWVRSPSEESLRRAAATAAQRTAFQSPEAWVAMAAVWSGGSMAPENAPVIPPGEAFTGRAVAGAVLLAAVRLRPAEATARLGRFLDSARDIATGGAGRLSPEEN